MVTTKRRDTSSHAYRRLRTQILRVSDMCWICQKPGATTIDHIVPVSLGGAALDPSNLRPAHLSCNSARGNGRRGMPTSRPW